mmetsp:Transcript_20156/g.37590  ORF Transcript_20156/g.37590 Transcript_20156/m.37590 type:complete len:467 (+) Transcript_20156:395-1795(+)
MRRGAFGSNAQVVSTRALRVVRYCVGSIAVVRHRAHKGAHDARSARSPAHHCDVAASSRKLKVPDNRVPESVPALDGKAVRHAGDGLCDSLPHGSGVWGARNIGRKRWSVHGRAGDDIPVKPILADDRPRSLRLAPPLQTNTRSQVAVLVLDLDPYPGPGPHHQFSRQHAAVPTALRVRYDVNPVNLKRDVARCVALNPELVLLVMLRLNVAGPLDGEEIRGQTQASSVALALVPGNGLRVVGNTSGARSQTTSGRVLPSRDGRIKVPVKVHRQIVSLQRHLALDPVVSRVIVSPQPSRRLHVCGQIVRSCIRRGKVSHVPPVVQIRDGNRSRENVLNLSRDGGRRDPVHHKGGAPSLSFPLGLVVAPHRRGNADVIAPRQQVVAENIPGVHLYDIGDSGGAASSSNTRNIALGRRRHRRRYHQAEGRVDNMLPPRLLNHGHVVGATYGSVVNAVVLSVLKVRARP